MGWVLLRAIPSEAGNLVSVTEGMENRDQIPRRCAPRDDHTKLKAGL